MLHLIVATGIIVSLAISTAFGLGAIVLLGRCAYHYWRLKP